MEPLISKISLAHLHWEPSVLAVCQVPASWFSPLLVLSFIVISKCDHMARVLSVYAKERRRNFMSVCLLMNRISSQSLKESTLTIHMIEFEVGIIRRHELEACLYLPYEHLKRRCLVLPSLS